ncbi:hypothetical protein F511_11940 [Dorcoceras hygrometricum]|uniref:Uncharacterized protein n=1 Tax=Dorcoceras hygrometricum TaxID=472368 RepID=A0A2Z7CP48_9LAMI|nr:hypothetical protein F511_11940 [Dorcoceras hygrometricum]
MVANRSQQGDESAVMTLALASWNKISSQENEVLPELRNARTKQQLRAFAPSNNSLQKWYGMEELLKRSPTLPRTYQKVVGNDGNSPEKLTVNSNLGFEAKRNNRENISLMMLVESGLAPGLIGNTGNVGSRSDVTAPVP